MIGPRTRVSGNVQEFRRFSKEAVVSIRFGLFSLDRDTRQLMRQGHEIHLSPKALELLLVLAEVRPRVVSKSELQQCLWPDTFVAEANLSNLIAEVRQGLGDHAGDPLFVRTAHGIGYAFCAEATSGRSSAPESPTPCWLEWGRQRFPLSRGEHIIGRDANASVRLDGSAVSRQHARLVVGVEGTVLEDCGSKNGTFRDGARVTSPVQLRDGDTIGIGSLLVVFCEAATSEATLTQAVGPP